MFDAATIVFFVFSILGGQVCIPILLATCLFSKRVHRHPLLLVFMACWAAYSLATCILLYSGHQGETDVDHSLCLAQAASINGSLIMASISAFLLVLHLRLTMPRPNKPMGKVGLGSKTTFALCVIPPISFIAYLCTILAIDKRYPGELQTERRDITCGFKSTDGSWDARRVSPIVVGVVLTATVALSTFLFTRTYSHRKIVTSGSVTAPWMRILLRFTIFAAYAFLTAIACLLRIILPDTMALHNAVTIYVATLPLAAFVVFGSLPDLISVWFRRRSHIATTSAPGASTTVPWDMRDPDQIATQWTRTESHDGLTRETTMAERWADEELDAEKRLARETAPDPSSSPTTTSAGPAARTRSVLRKASSLMRSAPKQTQPNLTGGVDTGEALERPHLAEAYYAGRIAREYYAERERDDAERMAAYERELGSGSAAVSPTLANSPTRSTPLSRSTPDADPFFRRSPWDFGLGPEAVSPVSPDTPTGSTPPRATPELDPFTQLPPRRSSPRRTRAPRQPREPDEALPFSQYHHTPRRPSSRPGSLYDPALDSDGDGYYSAGTSPDSPTTLGSPTPLLSSPTRQQRFEYPAMPVLAPRAAYATHHYATGAPVRPTPGSSSSRPQ